jgi:poly-gamma-glutamate synthesis protein (capsule biosynthesis protein)
MQRAIDITKKLRSEHKDSYLIAYMHWGTEYKHMQSNQQRTFAYELIDTGVDCIVGSHPHVVEGVETYKKGIIFYSLGNYIFDQYFSEETQQGYILSIKPSSSTVMFTLLPVVSIHSQVSLATSSAAEQILTTISENSDDTLRTQIQQSGVIVQKYNQH